MKSLKLFTIFLLFLLFVTQVYQIAAQKIDLKLRGSIIMYDSTPKGFSLNHAGASKIYVVKVTEILRGNEGSVYIFVVTNKEFNRSYWKANKTLEFSLKRVKGCDDKIKNFENILESKSNENPIPMLKLSKAAKSEDIPMNETLPCYLLRM